MSHCRLGSFLLPNNSSHIKWPVLFYKVLGTHVINTDLTDLKRNGQKHSGIGQDILHMVKPPKTLDPTFPMIQFNSVFHEPSASEPQIVTQSFCHKCKPHTHPEITSSNCFHGLSNTPLVKWTLTVNICGGTLSFWVWTVYWTDLCVCDQNAEVSESGSEKVYVPIITLELVTCVVVKTALRWSSEVGPWHQSPLELALCYPNNNAFNDIHKYIKVHQICWTADTFRIRCFLLSWCHRGACSDHCAARTANSGDCVE